MGVFCNEIISWLEVANLFQTFDNSESIDLKQVYELLNES